MCIICHYNPCNIAISILPAQSIISEDNLQQLTKKAIILLKKKRHVYAEFIYLLISL